MLKTDGRYHHFVHILREEPVPAMGCTEPIAIACGAAKAIENVGRPGRPGKRETAGESSRSMTGQRCAD